MFSAKEKQHLGLFIIYITISIISFSVLTVIHSFLTMNELHRLNFLIPIFASCFVGFILARHKIMQLELIQLANTDKLTGACNRLYFDERLKQAIDKAKRYKQVFSIIYLDIDYFKRVNDQFGHNTGDVVLKDFSNIASSMNRDSDIFARFGGEEFIILAHMATKEDALKLYQRIREAIQKHSFKKIKSINFSAGIAEFDIENDTLDRIIERADQALYQAKESGRDRAVIAP